MKLLELLKEVRVKNEYDGNIEISSITKNSKTCENGCLFFVTKGENYDGYNFIKEAINLGAQVIVTDRLSKVNCTQILVDDVLDAMSKISYNFFKPKRKRVKLIGVVGTNGKTTTTYILSEILKCAGKNVGVIGTLGIRYNNCFIAPELTTPDSIDLSEVLMNMSNGGVEYCVMELSAHAIALKRASAYQFEELIFTNCTQDHLDYFGDFSTYEKTKMSVFIKKYCKISILNIDDETGRKILNTLSSNALTYGLENPADSFAINLENRYNGVSFTMNVFDEISYINFSLFGKFNVYNCLAAATAATAIGIEPRYIEKGINSLKCVPGRLEFVEEFNGGYIYIDYAHTPDGLVNTLKALKDITKGRLILLFGCGGNRDSKKRSIMGEIAGEYSDYTIITSDNPRFEEPFKIISQIECGIRTKTLSYITIQNRYMATGYAIEMLKKGDVLVLCGKGDENYQEIMGVKTHYSDRESVHEIISKIKFSGETF